MILRSASLTIVCAALCATVVSARTPAVHDLQLTASPAATTVAVGGLVTFTLTPRNAGSASAAAATVKVTDLVPTGFTFVQATGTGWTCAAPNATCTNTAAVAGNTAFGVITLKVTATTAGSYSNFCAHIAYTGSTVDDVPTNNNPACATVVVQPQTHDLKLTMSVGGTTFNAGDVVEFALHPFNAGTGPVQVDGDVPCAEWLYRGAGHESGTLEWVLVHLAHHLPQFVRAGRRRE